MFFWLDVMAAFSPVCNLLNKDDLPTDDLPINEIVSKGLENLYIILASIIIFNEQQYEESTKHKIRRKHDAHFGISTTPSSWKYRPKKYHISLLNLFGSTVILN